VQLLASSYNSDAGSGFLIPRRRNNSVWRLGPLLILCTFLVACGGGGSSSPAPTSSGGQSGNNPAPVAEGGTPQPKAPTPIDVRGGSSASGIDVTVVSPASSPAPNAQDLGVNTSTGRASASNTGGAIHRGSAMRIILFGPGLNGQMQVRIGGPSDITVGQVTAIQATDNTPGVAFIATASGNAALGARSVFLQTSNGDVTSFTGGLEVIP
jgi:hypothetical protein